MNEAFQHFKNNRKSLKDKMKEDRASVTLDWYKKIQEMLDSPSYSRSEDYLNNVLEFIEKNEYVSEKQIVILDRILRHPDAIEYPPEFPDTIEINISDSDVPF